ncbi:MAG: ABC transporter permease subunit [Aigarchaeota archaeon]|nr:ABC transporter permease subunit [Aigarchaeota archaeon]MDW8092873.1 ABC transporter permease subunit [Nitrososphaerota archaeon]
MSFNLPTRLMVQLAIVASFFIGWEVFVLLRIYPEVLLPRPITVLNEVLRIVTTGRYLDHFVYTASTFASGLCLGSVTGLLFGMLMAELRYVRGLALPYILMVAAIPKSIFIPIILKFLGDVFVMKIAYISIFSFIFVSLNVLSGLRTLTADYLSMVKTFGATRKTQVYRKLLWPAAYFSFLASLRTATLYSLVGAIVGDLLYSPGIGYIVSALSHSLRTSTLYGVIMIVALIAITINFVLLRIEGKARMKLRLVEVTA